MSEIKAGDIRLRGKEEIHVVAVDGDYAWIKMGTDVRAQTYDLTWLHDWTKPVPDFFEEGKIYYHVDTGARVEVNKVFETSAGRFALVVYLTNTALRSAGDPRIFREESWQNGAAWLETE